MCGKGFKMKWHLKKLAKKAQTFFVLSQNYQDSRNIFQNPKIQSVIIYFYVDSPFESSLFRAKGYTQVFSPNSAIIFYLK